MEVRILELDGPNLLEVELAVDALDITGRHLLEFVQAHHHEIQHVNHDQHGEEAAEGRLLHFLVIIIRQFNGLSE